MNTQIQAAFDHALLAYAAYSNLVQGDDLSSKLTGWPPALATYLSTRYQVSLSYNSSGYNSVLFRGKDTDNLNHYVFANRGTEFDFINAAGETSLDLLADVGLATIGVNQQLLPMLNFFDDAMTTAGGNPVTVTGHSLGGYLSLMLRSGSANNSLGLTHSL